MPIKGLTDRAASLPQIGTLRKGDKKLSATARGKDLDYFRFVTEDPEASSAFFAAYGALPRQINVFLPFATVDENFEAWMEEYTASSLRHRCDGETCVLWLKADGTYSTEPRDCPGGCKQTGRLKVVIPELGRLAIVTVMMTSKNDILNLHSSLLALFQTQATGSLCGIPLILRRVEKKISTPRDGKRVRVTKWLLQIEAQPRWVALQLQEQERRALPGMPQPLPVAAPLQIGPVPDPTEWEIDEDDAEIEDGQPIDEVLDGEPVEAPPATEAKPDIRTRVRVAREALVALVGNAEAVDRKIAVMGRGVFEISQLSEEDLPKVEQMLNQFVALGDQAAAAINGKGAKR